MMPDRSRSRRRAFLACAALVLAVVPPARGQEAGAARAVSEIRDNARMFSPEAVREAQATLAKAEQQSHLAVLIETIESLDGGDVEQVAERRARQAALTEGFYMLFAKGDKKFSDLISRRQLSGRIARPKRVAIRDAFATGFRKGDFDAGLKKGAEAIAEALEAEAPAPAATATATAAEAGGSALVVRNQVKLTLAGARRILAAAEAKAAEMGLKMNIAVVDDGGHLLTFARMDGARPASAATAITKAVTAATFRQATGPLQNGDVLLNLSLQNAASASGGKITTLYGGVPIELDGQILGAVGCGGGRGEQDAEVAKAGIGAFLGDLKKEGGASREEESRPR